jgi:mRNA interferase MazF
VEIKYNRILGWIVLDQIRTVDKRRIIKVLSSLSEKEISKTKAIIRETYVE